MKHLTNALESLEDDKQKFINIEQKEDGKLVLIMKIQDQPVNHVAEEGGEPHGVVGLQASDILNYLQGLFGSLNEAYPCEENLQTLKHLEAADFFQKERTKDREARDVEGQNAE